MRAFREGWATRKNHPGLPLGKQPGIPTPLTCVELVTFVRTLRLELRAIAAAGASDDTIPYAQAIPADEADARPFLEQERCLPYVACSRARERLAVSWTGTPSRFLPVATAN